MKTLRMLLSVYGRELFGINKRAHMPGKRTGRRLSACAFYALAIVAALVVLAFAGFYCAMAAYGLNQVGMLRIYPGLVLALLCLMDLITTIARASDVLIKTRDFDLVTSLPIPAWVLAASRVIRLYIINLAATVPIWLPAGACYAFFAKPPLLFYPVYLLSMLLAPLLPVAIAAVLGAVIALISAMLGNGKYIRLILGFLFPMAIMYTSFSFSFNAQNEAALVSMVGNLSGMVNRVWPVTEMFTKACVDLDMAALAAFAAISIGAFALFCLVYGRFYVRLNTFTDGKRTRRRTTAVQGIRSLNAAMYQREMKRYLASNIYVMNTAFGMVLSLVGVVALAIMGLDKVAMLMELGGFQQYLAAFIPFVLACLAAMSCTTGSSISMEGKSLWIMQSMPVSAFRWFMSKIYVSLTVSCPVIVLDALVLGFALKLSAMQTALAILMPAGYALMAAVVGLWGNLRFHRFDWSNETAVVKQSLGAVIPVLLGMLLTMAPGVAMGFIGGRAWQLVPWLCTAGSFLISAALLAALYGNANRIVRTLG